MIEGLKLNDRRDTTGASTDGMPWQVRALGIIGVPAAIACFLVWFLAGDVTNALAEIKTSQQPLSGHVEVSKKLGETLQELERDHHESNIRLEGYMRLMCVQSAKTQVERNTCLSVR